MPNRRRRGAIVGLGQIAERGHLPGFRSAAARDRLEIVAAVDPLRAGEPGASLPIVADLDRLSDDVEFVDICTPTSSHVELCLAALERGLHVLCEKPVALNRDEARAIATAARDAQRVVMPCHQYRYNPAWRQVKAWLDQGLIGDWKLGEFQVYRVEADRGNQAVGVPWRGRRDHSRGGIVLDHGTHLIYELLDAAGGPPQAVHSWSTRVKHADYDVEDTAQIVMQYPDRLGVLFLTWAAHHRETRIRFVGEDGWVEWSGGLLTVSSAGRIEQRDFTAQLDKASYANWFGELFRDFALALERPAPDEAALTDIDQVAAVLETIYQGTAASLTSLPA